MNDKQKDELLHKLYYTEGRMVGRDALFAYVSKTLKNTEISRRYIAEWLSRQHVNQVYTQRRKTTSIRPIITSRPGAMIQADLIDFSKKPSKEGYRYILNVIDTFSRRIWLACIEQKTVASVIPQLNGVIQDIQKTHVINVIQTDNGNEFKIAFPRIKHIESQPYTPQAQALVERSNGTVKAILNKILYTKGEVWDEDIILQVENIYNSTVNRNLKGLTPDQAFELDPEQADTLHQHQKATHAKSYKQIDTELKVGNTVRIMIPKEKVKNKGQPTFSEETYRIVKVIKANPKTFTITRYKLANMKGSYPISKLLLVPYGKSENEPNNKYIEPAVPEEADDHDYAD